MVIDIATGEVLAMANLPTYNPNAPAGANTDTKRNRAITDVIEPGSTMKPLTVAAALEAGVITTHTMFDTNPGWMPNGKLPHDRSPQLRRARHDRRDHQELQRRRGQDRGEAPQPGVLRVP